MEVSEKLANLSSDLQKHKDQVKILHEDLQTKQRKIDELVLAEKSAAANSAISDQINSSDRQVNLRHQPQETQPKAQIDTVQIKNLQNKIHQLESSKKLLEKTYEAKLKNLKKEFHKVNKELEAKTEILVKNKVKGYIQTERLTSSTSLNKIEGSTSSKSSLVNPQNVMNLPIQGGSLAGHSESTNFESRDPAGHAVSQGSSSVAAGTSAAAAAAGLQIEKSVKNNFKSTDSDGKNIEIDLDNIAKDQLIDKILRLQKLHHKKNEKIEMLLEESKSKSLESKKQQVVINHLLNKLPTSEVKLDEKLNLNAKKILAAENPMLLVEMNGKLQELLEDTINQNVTLKENLKLLANQVNK